MSKVYKTLHVLNRGRGKAEIPARALFVPNSDKERDELLSLGAIVEASDAEAALHASQNTRGKGRKPTAEPEPQPDPEPDSEPQPDPEPDSEPDTDGQQDGGDAGNLVG